MIVDQERLPGIGVGAKTADGAAQIRVAALRLAPAFVGDPRGPLEGLFEGHGAEALQQRVVSGTPRPGTVAEFTPLPGTPFTPSVSVKNCGVHPAGAQPPQFRA